MAQTKAQAKKSMAAEKARRKKKATAKASAKRKAGQKKRVQAKAAGTAPRAAESLFSPESIGGNIIKRRKNIGNY